MRAQFSILICLLFLNGCALNRGFSDTQRTYLNQLKPDVHLTQEPSEQTHNIEVTYFGVSTLLLDDGTDKILIDGFFSRPSLIRLVTLGVDPAASTSKQRLEYVIKEHELNNLSAIVTVHSHHDHAMDAPYIAKITGADLVGSKSTCLLAHGMQQTQNTCFSLVDERNKRGSLVYGNFKITLVKTAHTNLPSFVESLVGVNEAVNEDFDYPARLWDYAEGESYSMLIEHPAGNIFVQANTNLIAPQLKNTHVDWLFMSVARLTALPDNQEIFNSIVTATNPQFIVPIHWDDFSRQVENRLHPQKYRMGESFEEIKLLIQLNEASDSNAKTYVMDYGDHIFITP